MPADSLFPVVRLDHHDCGVPADESSDPTLQMLIAGKVGLLFGWDGVDVRSGDNSGNPEPLLVGSPQQLGEEKPGADRPVLFGHRIK